MSLEPALHLAVLTALAAPAALLLVLGLGSLALRPLPESSVARMTRLSMAVCTLGLVTAIGLFVAGGLQRSMFVAHPWAATGTQGLEFDLALDGWSLSFALLAAVITATVGAFSYRYLHRERGFQRYFTLYACFVLGIELVALAGSMEVLLTGWELLGLSSALLVAFFHERRAPVVNALRVFGIYRVSDAAMVAAAVLLHHSAGSSNLSALLLAARPVSQAAAADAHFTTIALFLVVAMAAKSALLPFAGWLPRAMEGPTPSSAVYYGALSVHAGCYLLWRAEPLLEQSVAARVVAGALGLCTAVYATAVARTQTDVKSSLSYATLTQVGIIVVEIALGLRVLAFVHLVGNACLRLVQFLSAPNVLQDLRGLEAPGQPRPEAQRRPTALWVFSLERGGIDGVLDRWFIAPFVALARWGTSLDRRLAGERAGDAAAPPTEVAR